MMAKQLAFHNDIIQIRRLQQHDVSESYVSWLNNPVANQYLECRNQHHTLSSVKQYVAQLAEPDSQEILFGIFLLETGVHIGNIKLGPINRFHDHAAVGILIGDPSQWGRGFGTSAIKLLVENAHSFCNVKTFTAGCYAPNVGSFRAFIKAGWKHIGSIPSYWSTGASRRVDEMLLSYTISSGISFPAEGGITLIGAGQLMLSAARYLVQRTIPVLAVIAPRHNNNPFVGSLNEAGVEVFITENPNIDKDFFNRINGYRRFSLCFGPAWIFSAEVLDYFDNRIFNYNGIPLPSYIGGAHYTWQVLNSNAMGGCFIQQITNDIDRGPLFASKSYEICGGDSAIPIDYENANHENGIMVIRQFIDDCVASGSSGNPLLPRDGPDWTTLLYFPRLLTSQHGWIDWSWSGEHIDRFCRGFGFPYSGARTTLDGRTVSVCGTRFLSEPSIHPFCAGLITRIQASPPHLVVCVSGGFLFIDSLQDSETSNPVTPRLGARLLTPRSRIDDAMFPVTYDAHGPIPPKIP